MSGRSGGCGGRGGTGTPGTSGGVGSVGIRPASASEGSAGRSGAPGMSGGVAGTGGSGICRNESGGVEEDPASEARAAAVTLSILCNFVVPFLVDGAPRVLVALLGT